MAEVAKEPQGVVGESNQRLRTRTAIVDACRQLVRTGETVTMPQVARAALVSEATAYRYFPDLPSLLNAAAVGLWPTPAEALEPVADSTDPVERIAFACEFLLRAVLPLQVGVRAMIAATITSTEAAATRPPIRFGFIDEALAPLENAPSGMSAEDLVQLKHDLAAVVSAEALFSLIDLCALTPDDAIASLVGRLPDVRLPARLLWGDSDRIADAGYGRADAAAVPDARFQLLKDTGHVPWVEAPGQLLAAIWDHADTMSDGKASDMVPDVETLVPGAPGCERFGAGDATWQS